MNVPEYKKVVVFIEQRNSIVQPVSLELLHEARKLADMLNESVIAVLLGSGIKESTEMLIHYGADEVLYVDDQYLKDYVTEPYAQALIQILQQQKPNIVLFGATTIGRDLAPRISARLGTGLTADCTHLSIGENKELLMTRPTFGGNLIATIVCPNHRPQMSTIRPGVMQKMALDTARKGKISLVQINFDPSLFKVKLLKTVHEKKETKDITQSNIIIAGGRGIKKQETFKKLEIIAEALNGAVATSRVLVDQGWVPHEFQVGQTGKTVRPDIYLSFGISGAIQHTTGMEESDYIIAVNKDNKAPIFNICDLGLVCDLEGVVDALADELPKIKKGGKYEI